MKYVYPTVGNDPELFVTEKGKVVPSEKLLDKKKEKDRYSDDSIGREYKVKVDNAAVELNFPADTCLQVGVRNMSMSLRKLKTYYLEPKIHGISLKAALELSEEDMRRYSSLLQFGCDPSLLFYDNNLNTSIPLVDPRSVRYRSTGYHVHLGFRKPGSHYNYNPQLNDAAKLLHSTEGRVRLVRVCDMIVGLPSVLLERDNESVLVRRNVLGYGRAGEFREQPHGFEYRTLGPWPIIHPAWAWWANSAVRDALQIVLAGADHDLIKKIPGREISDAINTNDLPKATKLWTIVKRTLADLITDGRIENSKHAILGHNNIRLFEFAIATGGLGGTHFAFNNWLRGSSHWRLKAGFPRAMTRKVRSQALLNKFMIFSKKWDLTRDNLSEWL